jgi:hypothetical protein
VYIPHSTRVVHPVIYPVIFAKIGGEDFDILLLVVFP